VLNAVFDKLRERDHAETERHCLGIIVAPLLIPIMLIASYQDKKALKKAG
jgi:hypothetical protein